MPLDGRSLSANDEPDTFYESSSTSRRNPPPKTEGPDTGRRISAYSMYESYLADADKSVPPPAYQANRNSGVSNLGIGFLNMADYSYDDDSEDEAEQRRQRLSAASPLKTAALAATTQPSPRPHQELPSPSQQQQRPPQQQQPQQPPRQQRQPPQQPSQQQPPQQYPQRQFPQHQTCQPTQHPIPPRQQPITTPRPGYATPIATLSLARPQQAANAQGRLPPSSPNPSEPITPIIPVFALPSCPTSPIPRTPILRGNFEETLLPHRGEKGDDFWRRFSMIVKEESGKPSAMKESSWLRKTQSRSSRLNRWVWVFATLLILCCAAAMGLGVFLNRNAPGHQQPKPFGGSGDELGSSVSPTSTSATKSTLTSSSSLHVSPTHTVARRMAPTVPTLMPRIHRRKGLATP